MRLELADFYVEEEKTLYRKTLLSYGLEKEYTFYLDRLYYRLTEEEQKYVDDELDKWILKEIER